MIPWNWTTGALSLTQRKHNLCHSSDLEQLRNYWLMTNLIWLKNFMIQWASLHAFNYLMHMSGIQYLDEVRYFLCFHSIISVIVAICTIYVLMKYWVSRKRDGTIVLNGSVYLLLILKTTYVRVYDNWGHLNSIEVSLNWLSSYAWKHGERKKQTQKQNNNIHYEPLSTPVHIELDINTFL